VPAPMSPEGVVLLLQWCYVSRNEENHRTLFTDDYQFVFGLLDPEGAPWRTTPWTREDELAYFDHLVNGGSANQPPAQSITLLLDRNFQVIDDPRPGKTPPWHRVIRTSVTLHIVAENSSREVSGFANFFLVRGDSAAIPEGLQPRGTIPDSAFWYIERWEDETLPAEGARAMPSSAATWGGIKALYRYVSQALTR
ncbi:MAG TPA: hypothetical protein VFQ05_17330, partial [Candidatus Eisenbacteria bacterium]|nr:hypothetical protein [Candidatus Eisenbacteria bacterium]